MCSPYFNGSVPRKDAKITTQLRLAAANWITSRSPCHSSGSAAQAMKLRPSSASGNMAMGGPTRIWLTWNLSTF